MQKCPIDFEISGIIPLAVWYLVRRLAFWSINLGMLELCYQFKTQYDALMIPDTVRHNVGRVETL